MAYGAVTKHLVERVAKLEQQIAELEREREGLNYYVARVSDCNRVLQRKLDNLQKGKRHDVETH